MGAARGAVAATEEAEEVTAVAEVRLMVEDVEAADMAVVDMVALLLLTEVVVMALLPLALGESFS